MAPTYLFVTNDAWYFVSHRLPIAKSLASTGAKVYVCAKKDNSISEIEESGCTFIEWRVSPRGKSFFGEIFTACQLFTIICQLKPDILHLITIKAVLYGAISARILKLRGVICAVAGLGAMLVSGPKISYSRRLLLSIYTYALKYKYITFIFQNPDNRLDLETSLGISIKNYVEIKGSGVDLEKYKKTDEPKGVPTVVVAARLLRDKGILEFIEAAEIVKARAEPVNFILAGSNIAKGNPAEFTPQELEYICNNEVVQYIGHCDDMASLFERCHIVVLPSHHEGFPKVLVEAAACARVVITTDVPGCRHAILHGETGILIPKSDPKALAEAVWDLLTQTGKRIEMGIAGRELAEKEYDINKVVKSHRLVYESILSETTERQS